MKSIMILPLFILNGVLPSGGDGFVQTVWRKLHCFYWIGLFLTFIVLYSYGLVDYPLIFLSSPVVDSSAGLGSGNIDNTIIFRQNKAVMAFYCCIAGFSYLYCAVYSLCLNLVIFTVFKIVGFISLII